MPIAFTNGADLGGNGGTTNSLSSSYTCGSGTNRLLVVLMVGDGSTIRTAGGSGFDDITGVTYATVGMTLAAKFIDNTTLWAPRYSYLYYLLSPASGSNTVAINSTNNHNLDAVVADYTGVAQTLPDATTSGEIQAATMTSSITTIANNCWVILGQCGSSPSGAPTAGTGSILRVSQSSFNCGIFDSNGALSAGSHNMITNSSGAAGMSQILVSFAPVDASVIMGQACL
jgi:hypothetical protein